LHTDHSEKKETNAQGTNTDEPPEEVIINSYTSENDQQPID